MNKKEQILYAAMALLVKNGVQATPMSAIAKEAQTGMGTIYNYFATKEDLINALYIYAKQRQAAALTQTFTKDSIKKQFCTHYSAMINYLMANPVEFSFLDQFTNSPLLTQATKDESITAILPLSQLLLIGKKQKKVKPVAVNELLHFLEGALMSYVRWAHTDKTNKHSLDNHIVMVWDALKN